MNKRLSIIHRGRRAEPRGPAPRAREPGGTAVVEAARNLVHMKGAIAFMTQEKAVAWAELQVAIDSLESAD